MASSVWVKYENKDAVDARCDRVGKSTQTKLLESSLNALDFKLTLNKISMMRFPDRSTPSGKLINDYLSRGNEKCDGSQDDKEKEKFTLHTMHLLFSANRWEAQAQLKRLLAQGRIVIVDRYFYSGAAYSVANGIFVALARLIHCLDLDWCLSPDRGLLSPDLVIYLDLDPSLASERGDYGEERFETQEVQVAVAEAFRKIWARDEFKHAVKVVDAAREKEVVAAEILEIVRELLKRDKM